MKKKIYITAIFFCIMAILFFIICPPLDDQYCKIYPHISTKFNSLKFSEKNFRQINDSSTLEFVTKNIGEPFKIIDTSNDNIPYSHIFRKLNFKACGIKYIAYYSESSNILTNTYKWHLFVLFFNKDYKVVGKKDNWFEN